MIFNQCLILRYCFPFSTRLLSSIFLSNRSILQEYNGKNGKYHQYFTGKQYKLMRYGPDFLLQNKPKGYDSKLILLIKCQKNLLISLRAPQFYKVFLDFENQFINLGLLYIQSINFVFGKIIKTIKTQQLFKKQHCKKFKMSKFDSFPQQYNSFAMKHEKFNANRPLKKNNQLEHTTHQNVQIPGYELPYYQQFSRSPLASKMMGKLTNQIIQPRTPNQKTFQPIHQVQQNKEPFDSHITTHSSSDTNQKCSWKKILLWTLVALAMIALTVGFYFIISHLLTNRNPTIKDNIVQVEDGQYFPSISVDGGIRPVQVDPVPQTIIYGNQYSYDDASNIPLTYVVSSGVTADSTVSPKINAASSKTNLLERPYAKYNLMQDSVSPIDVYTNAT